MERYDDMDELLIEYSKTFDDCFPIFKFMGVDDEIIMNIIRKCLKDGKPYKTETTDNKIY